MCEMNDKKRQKKSVLVAKDCARIAAFVALTLAVQTSLAVFPGVELVTVLFVAFSFAFGIKRGVFAAVVFSVVRQLIFGFYPTVLVLYLVYFPTLAAVFGFLGKRMKLNVKNLIFLTMFACLGTLMFGIVDGIFTPLWYGYSNRVARLYFQATFTVTLPQVFCTAITVGLLFMPIVKLFRKL